ncbi:MAG TPA: COX15/CtaA family protein [Candidatus Acidoferrum sp.]|nr:COX15/CtaA family protein [Candidatus Acidoferrum sp.]
MAENSTQTSRGPYRLAMLTAGCTVLLLMAGALVTNNDAGDSVPDWPLAYGRLIPPLVGGIRFEYTHRVVAGIVAILTLVLAVWLTFAKVRPLAKTLGWSALVLVLAQAGLGALRVEEIHPMLSATAHATLAQIFFITVVGLSLYLSPWWEKDLPRLQDTKSPGLRTLTVLTTLTILAQLILGAAFRHGAFGIDPHLVGAGVVTILVVWTGRAAKKRFRENRDLRRSTIFLHSFFGLQILLGFAAWYAVRVIAPESPQPTVLFVTLTVAHVLGGALVLAASALLMLTAFRLIPGSAEARSVQSPEGAGALR